MTYPKAIVISAALLAASIAFAAYQPAQSAFGGGGRYLLSASSDSYAWVIDTEAGEVRWCAFKMDNQSGPCRIAQPKW